MSVFKVNAKSKDGHRLSVHLKCKDKLSINKMWENWLKNNPEYEQYSYKIIEKIKIN